MVKSNTNKLLLILMIFLFSFFGISCVNDNEYAENSYVNYIDPLSSITFDYENPNYGQVSLSPISSYLYLFDGEEIYDVISLFNDISLNNSIDRNNTEEYRNLYDRGNREILIEVSYKYSISEEPSDDAIVHFYILSDGTLIFEESRKTILHYSEPNAVDLEKFRNKVIKIEGK